jgi:hypothetical protein
MTKEELISLVQNTVRRVDKTNAVHERVVEMALGRAINTMMYEVFRNDMSNIDLYTRTYENVSITDDVATLPAQIVQLPKVGDGVIAVRATGESVMGFYPMTIQQAQNSSFMETSSYMSDVGYVVKNTTVEFVNLPDTIEAVDMDLVRPFEAYAMDEEFYVPAGQDENILRRTLEIMGIVTPVNLLNNNADEPNRSQGDSTGGN